MGLFKLEGEYFDGLVKIISSKAIEDDRGFFAPSFRADEFAELGIPEYFVQDNHSRSKKDVVRGLHFQLNPPMGKLMRVTRGAAYLVAVDIRWWSPTFLRWIGVHATEENRRQLWAPAEFARGFCAMSHVTDVQYKCSGLYSPTGDLGIRWDDPDINVKWPTPYPIVSERDRNAPTVAELVLA
jgi:dTDP-4-dehydrorhamnose 3,5-epimerase